MAKKRKPNYKCDYCGKDIYVAPGSIRRKQKYTTCSRNCQTRLCIKIPSKTYLNWLYWSCEMTLKDIAEFIGVDKITLYNYMNKCNIPKRTSKEAAQLYCLYISPGEHYMCGKPGKSGKDNGMYGRTGKDNPNYNPNLTDEDRVDRRILPGYNEWRIAVYEKDNYTCQCCGDNKGGNLVAHHIEAYRANKELRTEVSNGTTLCEDCHKDFHHQYGYGNNTRKQYNEFIQGVKHE